MLVATLMVIAVSGYAAEQFVPILTTNFDDGNLGNWDSWGNSSTREFVDSDRDGGGKYLKLTNPSAAQFWEAQLGYEFSENLVPSKEYTIKFWVKCENGSSQLQFQYQHHEGDTYTPQGGYQTIDITGDWQHIERKVTIAHDHANINRILINFGQNAGTFYIDDIEFGSYEEVQEPDPDPTPDPTPTGSLNNTMYYDGTQWCLMLEDFEGKTIGDSENVVLKNGSDGTATVVADPLGKSNNSLNFISGNYTNENDYYYIDVTLPEPKTLSDTYFEKLIFDVVCNKGTGVDNNNKSILVKIGNISTGLGNFWIGTPNTESWSQQSFSLAGKYTNEKTFRIYIGGVHANRANLFIDNIRLSVKTTASGTCGKTTPGDAGWMLDGNTLYISGTGDIADYDVEPNNIPWNANKDNISKIIIGEGITAIGTNNFFEHNKLESVVLPSTLKQIGSKGLYASNENKTIQFTFHSNPTMAADALNKNSSIATLVLDDALSPFFEATSENTFNGGIQYKRTLSAEKSTITLPFTPKSGSANCKFYKLSSASENNLTFEEVSKTNLVAGNPYIMVKTEGSNEIDFSTDESTIIPANAKASDTTSGPWTMHGTYSTIEKGSGDNAYGFTGNYLRKNTGTMTVKPFRAYFTTPSTTAKDYLDVIFGGEVTGIERNEFSPEGITEIFSLDGKKHDCLQKGMNIVKMNNGSIKKIVIK